MHKICLFFLAILPHVNFGLLPPLYESLNQFKTLINDERLPPALQSGEAITSIRLEDSRFIITTNKSTLQVNITSEPQHLMGPGKYKLDFEIAKPLQSGN